MKNIYALTLIILLTVISFAQAKRENALARFNGSIQGAITSNDGTETLANKYSNSLAFAISSIGKTETDLVFDANTIISTKVIVPENIRLVRKNNAKIIKSGSATLEFQGLGLMDSQSKIPAFSRFNAGDIIWTGKVYPKDISGNLWDNASLSEKMDSATKANIGNKVTIHLYEGNFDAQVIINEGHSVHLTPGNYTSSCVVGEQAFVLESNTRLYGDGIGLTKITESPDELRLVVIDGAKVYPFDGIDKNVIVEKIAFIGNPLTKVDTRFSTVFLANCHNCYIQDNYFQNTHGFAAYVGMFGTANNEADGAYIRNNITRGLYTQQIGTVGGMNVIIDSNQMLEVQTQVGGNSASIIDIEPNAESFGSENLQITNNIIDARLAQSSANAITVQRGYGANLRNVRVQGNIIIGANTNKNLFKDSSVNPRTDTITVDGHGFLTGQQLYMATYDGGRSLPAPLTGDLFWTIRTGVDTFKLANSYANAIAEIPIDITGTGFDSYVVMSRRGLTNGITMDNCDGCVVSNNTIIGTTQNCIESYTSYNLIISDNALNMCGGGGNNAMLLSSNTNTIVKNNVINRTTILSQSTAIFENFKTISVDTRAGSPIVQGATGYYHPHWFTDKTITINGIDYTIKDVERGKLILTTNAVSSLSGTTATLKFSSNKYFANFAAEGIKLVTGGTSTIISNY